MQHEHPTPNKEQRVRLGLEAPPSPPPPPISQAVQRIAANIGLEGMRLHDVRHGVATALASSGTPAYVTSKVLGHSSVHFTANVYQHADDESIDRALAGLEAAFGQ